MVRSAPCQWRAGVPLFLCWPPRSFSDGHRELRAARLQTLSSSRSTLADGTINLGAPLGEAGTWEGQEALATDPNHYEARNGGSTGCIGLLFSAVLVAADPPYVGRWKVNEDKTDYGLAFTFSRSESGELRLTQGDLS